MNMNVGNTSTHIIKVVVSNVSPPNYFNQIWGHSIFATDNDDVQL